MKLKLIFFVFISFLLFSLPSCQFEKPTAVWQENTSSSPVPVISQVEPAGGALADYSTITIIGQHFAPVAENNTVYFGKAKAMVLSATSTELQVKAPDIVGDSLLIQVVVPGAFLPAKYSPYKLEKISVEYGGFANLDWVTAMALDKDENLYAHLKSKDVEKVEPPDIREVYGSTAIPIASEMRMGPGGYLYVQRFFSKNLYVIPPGGGAAQVFAVLPKSVGNFDFDENGNIFIGGTRTGMFIIKPDTSNATVGDYKDFAIKSIRVFQGYVYVAAQYLGRDSAIPKWAIWKNKIMMSEENLGENQLVFNWANAGDFSAAKISSITFSENGELYVATDHVDPIAVIHSDGTIEPLYPGILTGPFSHIVWGEGNFIYANRQSSDSDLRRVIRIATIQKGAPYYGRK